MDDREMHVRLAELAQRSIARRYDYDWKVSLGLWFGVGVFTWFVVKYHIAVNISIVLTLYALIAFCWAGWEFLSQGACHVDKLSQHKSVREMFGKISGGDDHYRFRLFWWGVVKVAFTVLLLALSSFVIYCHFNRGCSICSIP